MGGSEKNEQKMSIYPLNIEIFFETHRYSKLHKKGWHKLFKIGKNFRGGIKQSGIKI